MYAAMAILEAANDRVGAAFRIFAALSKPVTPLNWP